MVQDITKKKKTANPNQLKSHQKNFELNRTQAAREKGVKLVFGA